MVAVRTDFGAFAYGLLAVGLFTVAAAIRGWGVALPAAETWDAVIVHALKGGAVYVATFGLGHLALRHFGVPARSAYAGLGAACAIASFAAMLEPGAFADLLQRGVAIPTFAIPALVGAVVGFLYHARAGYDAKGDDPTALAGLLVGLRRQSARPDDTGGDGLDPDAAAAEGSAPDPAHLHIGTAEYFDGPLQVRTSLGSMILAAFGATFLYMVGMYFWSFAATVRISGPGDPGTLFNAALENAGLTGAMFLATAVFAVVPFAVMIFLLHYALRALDRTSILAYGLAGLAGPVLIGFVTLFAFAVVGLALALPSAIAMIIYRNLAGVEPKPVAEDIEVRDRRNLVGADHARRRYRRVIPQDAAGK